jgi:chromosome partitioning protein
MEEYMAKVISFSNQKGGVGKTTSCVNISAQIANKGKKVLMIDMDPQGNATSGLGISKAKIKRTTYDVIIGRCDIKEAIIVSNFKNLSVVPANIDLAGAEFELHDLDENLNFTQIALDSVKEDYDYIFIDCPPSLGMLTVNAMTASDGVVIPMQCEFFALEGLSQLMFTISRIKTHYNKDLNVTGILITMHNNRLILSMQVISELRKHYADKLFETTVSRNVKVSEAPGFGAPVYYHEKRSKGSVEYMNVAKELAERI